MALRRLWNQPSIQHFLPLASQGTRKVTRTINLDMIDTMRFNKKITLKPGDIARAVVAMVSWYATATPAADLVELSWDSTGGFERTLTVPPAKFAEVCGRLTKDQSIAWSFTAQQPLNFNIHYHEGKNVVFPVKQNNTASLDGTLAVPADQDYCWMWENQGSTPASIALKLRRG